MWVVRVGGDDGELRPWHYIYVYSIESRMIMRVRYLRPQGAPVLEVEIALPWPSMHLLEELQGQFLKLPPFLELTNTDPFAAWFVVTGDATPDEISVVRAIFGAISSLPIVAFRS